MAPRKTTKSSRKSRAQALPRADGVNTLTAAEYARRVGITKPRMSEYFAKGMPWHAGKDQEGRRDSKLVNIRDADMWRMANTEVRIAADGTLRGLNMAGGADAPAGLSHAGSTRGEGVNPGASEAAAAGPPPAPPPTPSASSSSASSSGQPEEMTAQQATTLRIMEAKASGVEADASAKIMRLRALEGSLLDREAAVAAHRAFVQKVGTAIDRMPSNLAGLVAAQLGVPEHAVFMALTDIVSVRMREDLAKDARSHADAARRRGGKR